MARSRRSRTGSMLTTLPNLLTLSRILVIPLFVGVFFLPGALGNWVSFALFLGAALTDYLDGLVARRWRQVSALGRFLDPIADKLLVASAILMLVAEGRAPLLPALVILCREILVSGLREFLAELRVGMPVSRLAKWKTGIQVAAILFLLVGEAGPVVLGGAVSTATIGEAMMWLAALLTFITGYDYLRVGLRHIGQGEPSAPRRPRSPAEPAGRSL